MCAIAGFVDRSRGHVERAVRAADAMRRAMAHRGPDGWGLVALRGGRICYAHPPRLGRAAIASPAAEGATATAALAHQRLAVIDLTPSGHQPMVTPDGRFWISYNGEIYNYRALRAELEREGVSFAGTSDTEVLLALFARHGPSAFVRLRGMFAAAIWDTATETLWLVRDRFGIKPLYYARPTAGTLLFASEVKGLLASGAIAPEPDEAAPLAFLRRGSLPTERTFFRGIAALPPGHWARWTGDLLQVVSYWSLLDELAGTWRRVSTAEAAARIRDAVDESVQAHLVSDVPVGVFLSGGLDSTAVVSAVRRRYSGPLRTLTVVVPGTPLDESALARRTAAEFATEHVEIALSHRDLPACLDEFFAAMDEPTIDGLNTYLVARAAHDAGLKVVLSGLGGDELLGGYESFVRAPRAARWLKAARGVPGLLPGVAAVLDRLPLQAAPKAAELLRAARTDPALAAIWRATRRLFSEGELSALGWHRGGDIDAPPLREPDRVTDPFAVVTACEIAEFMIPQLLRDTDVFSLRWGVEVRTPLVDHLVLRAVRAAGCWPRGRAPSFKLALFRALDGLVPREHLAQRKRGFFLPVDGWLRRALEQADVSPLGPHLAALAARPRYQPFVDRFLHGRLHWSRLWALYVLERFADEFPRRWTFPSSSSITTAGDS